MEQYGSPAGRFGTDTSAAGQAKELAQTGTRQLKDLGQTTKERALREIDTRREGFAGEIEKLAGTLESQGSASEAAGPALQMAAGAARRLSSAMKDNTAEELFRMAARNPAVMLGGAFAAGFLLTRLLKE